MKANRKITVKDIALKCNVSKALAAAVLSNSKNNIGCSDAKREKILKAAQKLNYRPNRLARAMSTGIVPLVAVCVNHINFQDDEINLYLHDLLPSMTFALKRYGFNTIFVPYDGVKELMEQVGSLADDNLIGGIITNFPPENQSQVVNYLKKIKVPHVVMGKIKDKSVPCVSSDNTVQYEKIAEYAQNHGFKRAVRLLARKNMNNGTSWSEIGVLHQSSPMEYMTELPDFNVNDTLWVAMGEFTRRALIQEKCVSEKNIISVESKRVLIQFKPTVFVRSELSNMAGQAAELLSEWIKHGKIPEPVHRTVKALPEDIEFVV